IGIATAMFIMHWKLALLVLTVIPVLMWISVIFQQHILKSARNVRKSNSRLTAAYNESIMGVRTSKAFVREEKNLEEFQTLSNNMYRFSVLNAIQSSLYLPIVLTLASLATGLALAFGGMQMLAGVITAGTLIAFISYTRHFFEPIEQIAAWFAEMQMAQASAERIIGLIESEPAIQDLPTVIENMRQARTREHGPSEAIDGYPSRIESIECHNMSFEYLPGQPVLQDINLTIKAGENIAIVGSTGGGKSTLASLICRFYEPTQGQVLIDGVDYRNRSLHWLQSQLGVVLQSSHIFSGSVRENVRYGKLEATDEEIIDACKLSGAHSFIESLEKGYDTDVGEGGGLLSAGQKQLISFARAILADPQILIMDEATSSIDTETEQLIQQGMQHLLEGRISLVIAHRLSTIRNADRILVMEQGCIAEQGSHDELIAQQGRYYKLYQQQAVRESAYSDEAWAAA
ncbi:MAG: ABC transporter ATP-binding protein, partial [Pseudomonadota bacterium]